MDKIFVLIGEIEGDYNDSYQRPREVLLASYSKESLENKKEEEQKAAKERKYEFIEFCIEEIDIVKTDSE